LWSFVLRLSGDEVAMICITGRSSNLKCSLFPPLDLTSSKDWEMGFLDLMTYNSIPNVEENENNKIGFEGSIEISLPTGSYEIDNISEYINKELKKLDHNIIFELTANNNTLKSEIFCSKAIDFTSDKTLGPLLGFTKKEVLEANKWHESPDQVIINKVDVIRITCDIVRGSYRNGTEGHVLHEFYPTVAPGFKIVEKPNTVTYLPINKQNSIEEFNIRLEDQDSNLVNFRGESINLRVEIRERQRR